MISGLKLIIGGLKSVIGNLKSIIEGLKSVIGGKEISWIFGKPEKCDSVKAKQAFCYG